MAAASGLPGEGNGLLPIPPNPAKYLFTLFQAQRSRTSCVEAGTDHERKDSNYNHHLKLQPAPHFLILFVISQGYLWGSPALTTLPVRL